MCACCRKWLMSWAVLAGTLAIAEITYADGACCTTTECTPAADAIECSAIGGVFLPDADCADDACAPGACCSQVNCVVADAFNCIMGGRDFLGAGTTCLDDPCEIGVGACCNNGACNVIPLEECQNGGGIWLGGGTSCLSEPCVQGTCCSPGMCEEMAHHECEAQGGAFEPGASCEVDDCQVQFDCATNSLYSQTRDGPEFFTAYVSEASAGLMRKDNYSDALGAIEGVTWWGLDLEFDGQDFLECTENNNEFDISFHEDIAGDPGPAVCSYTLTADRTDTGILYQGTELVEFNVTLPAPCVRVNGWVSIVGLGDPDCWFLWVSSLDGDDRSICEGCESEVELDDLSFCLGGDLGGVFGACCDFSTGVCAEGVEIIDCAEVGLRFTPDTACEDTEPPCAQTTGACCFDTGDCFIDLPADCTTAGGNWLGANTSCTLCPAVGACCVDFDNCVQTTEIDCESENLPWLGAGSACSECPAQPLCPEDSLSAQIPDQPSDFLAGSSEDSSPFQRWENFSGVTGAIDALTWWGLDMDFIEGSNSFVECAESDNIFEISFHSDAGGMPGAAVCTFTVLAERNPTGILYLGAEMNEYVADLPESCAITDGWVSILGFGDPECWFLWMSSDLLGQSYCEGCIPSEQNFDLSLCLRGTEGGVFGACCDDETGSCDEAVEIIDCVDEGQRFEADALCDDLQPQCGEVVGACCMEDATCSVELQDSCDSQGGNWLGPDTQCSACPCLVPCPEGASIEGEPVCTDDYVDTFNGGCDAKEIAFSEISTCDTVCGQGGVFAVGVELVAEFDWYEITIPEFVDLTWTVEAEFPVLAAIVDGNNGCDDPQVLALDSATECMPLSLTVKANKGIYWLVVGASGPSDLATCGASYVASVSAFDLVCPCPADFNGDGVVGPVDLAFLLGSWGFCADCSADLNGDGEVGPFDLASLLGAWGPCS